MSWQNFNHHSAVFVGFSLGFLCSLPFLNGNASGQVNILILLLLFAGLPMIGIVLSCFAWFGKEARLLQSVKASVLYLGKPPSRAVPNETHRLMLLYHGNYAAVGWALGSIAALLLLLIFTDINFVWRSTLLTPQSLLPVLNAIALPWFFWDAAQPSMSLLTETQDSRLTTYQGAAIPFSQWWPFVFACQLFYSLLLRLLLMLVLRIKIETAMRRQNDSIRRPEKHVTPTKNKVTAGNSAQLPTSYYLVNWAGFSATIIQQLGQFDSNEKLYTADSSEITAGATLIILVKVWEPPLKELEDFLDDKQGIIFPIDVKNDEVIDAQERHLDEWARFVSKHSGWQLYVANTEK